MRYHNAGYTRRVQSFHYDDGVTNPHMDFTKDEKNYNIIYRRISLPIRDREQIRFTYPNNIRAILHCFLEFYIFISNEYIKKE